MMRCYQDRVSAFHRVSADAVRPGAAWRSRFCSRQASTANTWGSIGRFRSGLTPFEAICEVWTKEPGRFRLDPTHLTHLGHKPLKRPGRR